MGIFEIDFLQYMNIKDKLFWLLTVIIIAGCKKERAPDCVAMQGGNINFEIRLMRNGIIIPNDSLFPDTVWVKYNALQWFDAPHDYSIGFIGEPGEDHIHIPSMTCGDYFFYASGYDTAANAVVSGGTAISVDGSETLVEINIPVKE
jgi:hypothetical protein